MKHLQYFSYSIFLLAVLTACGGARWLESADEAYGMHDFQKAIELYEKGLEKAYEPSAFARLAECYRRNGQYEQAAQWYEKAVAVPGASAESHLHYALALKSSGRCAEASAQASAYLLEHPGEGQAEAIVLACRQADSLELAENGYQVNTASFNSTVSDFSPAWMGDQLVFTSERGGGATHSWTGRSYVDLYYWQEGMAAPLPLPGDVNSKWHDGPAAFAPGGQVMYFTRNTSGKERTGKLEILEARLSGSQWLVVKALPFNERKSTAAHPALSPDGNSMVFASDREGGYGGMDLYYTRRQGDGWSEPANLGPAINTGGHDVFPFIAPTGALYFSSDGLPGLGGLDLFVAQPGESEGRWKKPENLKAPFNSHLDDFGLLARDGLQSGYFSSSRGSENGIDNLYQFKKVEEQPASVVNGIVVDEATQLPLEGVAVQLRSEAGQVLATAISDAEGKFQFPVEPGRDYELQGEKNGIATTKEAVSTKGAAPGQNFFVMLSHNDPRFTLNGHALDRKTGQPVEGVLVKLLNTSNNTEVTTLTNDEGWFTFQLEQNADYLVNGTKKGLFSSYKQATTRGLNRSTVLYVKLTLSFEEVELGTVVTLENIYFDFDESTIRADAARELDFLAQYLAENPELEIELGSHTDSRGADDYNLRLSEARAQSTRNYLVGKGIAYRRLAARGYGETQLANGCDDGVPCTEEQHQKNRRTEFKVIGMGNSN